MTPSSSNPDKTIVERRVAHAGDKSRAAVRELRAGLGTSSGGSSGGGIGFQNDVLKHHAKLQAKVLPAFLVAGALTAFVTQKALTPLGAGIWLGVIALIIISTILAARRFLRLEAKQIIFIKWERIFMGCTAAIGLTWTVILALVPLEASGGELSTAVFATAIIITVISFVSARFMRFGVLIAAGPMIALLSTRLAVHGSMSSIGFAVMMVTALVFFQLLGQSIRASLVDFLKSRAERDQLIMELESARGISEEARRRAEDANLAKSRFLATMSHELRTPLNAILGFSEVISNEVMGPINNSHYKEYIGDIHRSGAHLLKLINEILDLSRVEAGRYELNEEATNLAHAAEESQQMVKLKASEKNVNLIMQIQPDMPQIWADARSIRQVILNLLSNALKFTPPGGSIWLKVGWTAGGGQYLSIRDTGPGIPEDEIPIVLSSFGQGSIAIKSAEQGTGLGLPIVQALVQMHDGKFELKSKLREGTEVIATFPRSRVMEVMAAMPVDTQPQQPRSGMRRSVQAPALSG